MEDSVDRVWFFNQIDIEVIMVGLINLTLILIMKEYKSTNCLFGWLVEVLKFFKKCYWFRYFLNQHLLNLSITNNKNK